MQHLRGNFLEPTYKRCSSLQSCIRTNDIDLVGDGSHLTYFEMLGNFSFGNNDYHTSVDLWDCVIKTLKLPVTEIKVHKSRDDHKIMWIKKGYRITDDLSCTWSDGDINGECCEVFCNDLEIGNLVNPLNHSTDVGFGFERVCQVIQQKNRVDETSMFIKGINPIVNDHIRSLTSMKESGIIPSNKGRGYVCRKLIRRILTLTQDYSSFDHLSEWMNEEKLLRDKIIQKSKKYWNKNSHKNVKWWWETFGLLPEEIEIIKQEN